MQNSGQITGEFDDRERTIDNILQLRRAPRSENERKIYMESVACNISLIYYTHGDNRHQSGCHSAVA